MTKLSVILPVLIPDEFCRAMTQFCVSALRSEADDKSFELVMVETGSRYFAESPLVDQYIYKPKITNYVSDWNEGADAAKGDFIVHYGNDIFAGKHWDTALLEPYALYPDCGLTTTSIVEPSASPIGHDSPINIIVEGHMTALMCMRNTWRLDTVYSAGYSDADLLMRIYTAGLRSYRNYKSVAYHMRGITWQHAQADGGKKQMDAGEDIFYARWADSPLWVYSMIRGGGVHWAKEHAARCTPTPPQQRGR